MISEATIELVSTFFSSIARSERETERARKELDIHNYDPFSSFRFLDFEGKGCLSVDGIQIFLSDLDLSPERFTETDFSFLLELLDDNADG